MDDARRKGFDGFSPKTFEFLLELEFNNRKDWFEENKPQYREFVLKPFQELVGELSGFMLEMDSSFETRGEIDKTISRIYRDVRFSKDKSPYRSSAWITFKRAYRDWKLDPCFFFEITPHLYRYGMGFYTASRAALNRLRELIDEDSDEFREILALYKSQKQFTLEGEVYKRPLDKSKTGDPFDWYQRKNIYFMCTKKIDSRLFEKGLADDIKQGFELMKPFYAFLWKIKMEGEENTCQTTEKIIKYNDRGHSSSTD